MSGDNKMQAMDARRKAEAKLAQSQLQDKAFFKERKRIEAVNAEKTARLKALRLAKEAVDREAAEKAAAEAASRPRKSRTTRGSRVTAIVGSSGISESALTDVTSADLPTEK